MPNITTIDNWGPDVYQWADGDVLDGGPESLEVLPIKQLGNRSVYQRLRNVTPWSDTLAAAYGYPQGACVMHVGFSWRAKIANNVAPGSDATRWERWAYSESELAAYLRGSLLSPVRCPATGPAAAPSDASPYTIWKSIAPYNEYWQWLGDAWKVIADHYASLTGVNSIALTGGTLTSLCTITAHRNGSAILRGIVSALNAISSANQMSAQIRRTRAGVTTTVLDATDEDTTQVFSQYAQARPYSRVQALTGDVYTLVVITSSAMNPSPDSGTSIHLEYEQ